MKRVYMYEFHERVWHWTQALVMIALMITGMVIHMPTRLPLMPFEVATTMHEGLGILLIVNAAGGLLYFIFSSQFGQYLPPLNSFLGLAIEQVVYYSWGIFNGAPHPVEKTKERKLNALQQITYLGILNFLLPLQIVTGALILLVRYSPELALTLGKLGVIAPLHMVGAWGFIAFLLGHIYLATTGHTVLSNFTAMITGWEDLEDHHEAKPDPKVEGGPA